MENQITNVCFTGHRPNKLYGYRSYEDWRPLFDAIYLLCEELYHDYGTRTFVTGGAQGVDQTAFWAVNRLTCAHLDVNNVVYVPMKGQELRWKKNGLFGQNDYKNMLSNASEYCVLNDTPSTAALLKRNEKMVNDTDAVIAVWDGEPEGGTAACVRYAEKMHRKVIRIDPRTFVNDL